VRPALTSTPPWIEPVVSRALHIGGTGSRCDGRYGCVCSRLRGCAARRSQRTPPPTCTWELFDSSKGTSTSARPLLERALELRPGHPLTRLELAKLDGMTGKYARPPPHLEDLEKNDPKWLDPHIELAAIYYKLHRPKMDKGNARLCSKLEENSRRRVRTRIRERCFRVTYFVVEGRGNRFGNL
jgi:hypothetical protein